MKKSLIFLRKYRVALAFIVVFLLVGLILFTIKTLLSDRNSEGLRVRGMYVLKKVNEKESVTSDKSENKLFCKYGSIF